MPSSKLILVTGATGYVGGRLVPRARMAQESDVDAATLRARVTSKGGTTEAAIKPFQQHHFEQLVNNALAAANHRAGELADILGKDS